MDRITFDAIDVEIEYFDEDSRQQITTKSNVKWSMQPHPTRWGIFSWGLKVETQELNINTEIYNEETDEEEEKTFNIKLDSSEIDCKMRVNHASNDFSLIKLDLSGKKAIAYFGCLD